MPEPVLRPVREIKVGQACRLSLADAAAAPGEVAHRRHPWAQSETEGTGGMQAQGTGETLVLLSALSVPAALEKVGVGTLCVLSEDADQKTYGRALTVADRLSDERVIIAKWIRRLINWSGRQAPLSVWQEKIVPLIEKRLGQQKTPVFRVVNEGHKIIAQVSIDLRPGQPGRWLPVLRRRQSLGRAVGNCVP